MKRITQTCGCCAGIETVTPELTANRPGLSALSYRIGSHATFLETMLARLSSSDFPKLAGLTTRETNDPSIALLDAWAIVADVLTFYNERIINEGYLPTATERRSILELARLVGYKLRPGVAASVYLAYTLDSNMTDEVLIPKGARSQSLPGPGELPQSFETSDDLKARAKWNNLKPRLTQPQTVSSIKYGDGVNAHIYLQGISTNLKANDPLLIDFAGNGNPVFDRIKEVEIDTAANRTRVILQSLASSSPIEEKSETDLSLIETLIQAPSVQLANSLLLEQNVATLFLGNLILPEPAVGNEDNPDFNYSITANPQPSSNNSANTMLQSLAGSESSHAILKAMAPTIKETLPLAAGNAEVTETNPIKVYALKTAASLFGHSHPGTPNYANDPNDTGMILITDYTQPTIATIWPSELVTLQTGMFNIPIEPSDEQINSGSWVAIERPDLKNPNSWLTTFHTVKTARPATLSGLGISTKVSLLEIDLPWLINSGKTEEAHSTAILRKTTVYTRSELLELAEEPITNSICGQEQETIELDGFYEGLEAGRWVVVTGERELSGTSGVKFSELAMLSSVTQNIRSNDETLYGDKLHTFIKLANKLEYCFKRDTVTIYGNVVKATHGETRQEVLGSGDSSKALQTFNLKQPPLTYVSASNPSGVDNTLKVYVNNIAWHETDTLSGLTATDRRFVSKTDNDDKTSIIFGNGREGALLPSGIENIKAEYRNGIGKSGNVKAEQISLLMTKPLGTKAVINPLKASGGADRESLDQARKNTPIAIKALDRLVSVQDYQDFARSYAGIGKASAMELSDGRRQVVHVTIAGADDSPIDKNSDLYKNLRKSLLAYGDPYQTIQLETRELMLIVIEAKLRILADYLWEPVVTEVRTKLLDNFGFERRELGQDVLLSEVICVMQAVPGVEYVDVDVLRGIPEKIFDGLDSGQRRLITTSEIVALVTEPLKDAKGVEIKEPVSRLSVNFADFEGQSIRPAQLAFLSGEVPATLILNQIN